jgi:hypothetical protein
MTMSRMTVAMQIPKNEIKYLVRGFMFFDQVAQEYINLRTLR